MMWESSRLACCTSSNAVDMYSPPLSSCRAAMHTPSIGLVLLECSKGIRLGLQRNHHSVLAVVINPGAPVAISRGSAHRQRAMDI